MFNTFILWQFRAERTPKDIAENVSKTLIGNNDNLYALNELIKSISKLHKESYLKASEVWDPLVQ